jgi:hypothetical protein
MPCDHLPHVSLQSADLEGAVWQQLERKCAKNPAVLAVLYERQEAKLRQAQQQLQADHIKLTALQAKHIELQDQHMDQHKVGGRDVGLYVLLVCVN